VKKQKEAPIKERKPCVVTTPPISPPSSRPPKGPPHGFQRNSFGFYVL
jgi:hypothetical protein